MLRDDTCTQILVYAFPATSYTGHHVTPARSNLVCMSAAPATHTQPEPTNCVLFVQGRPVLNGKAPQVSPGDVNQQTGRWGEELVFCYLQWQLAAFHPAPGLHCDQAWECRSTGWLVEWINYREETRKPFDIRLRSGFPQGLGSTLLSIDPAAACCVTIPMGPVVHIWLTLLYSY